MRCSERPGPGQAALGDQARHRMDHGGLKQFGRRQGRQEAGQALGQHGLARPRWSDKTQIMAARRSDLERAFGTFLALNVFEIRHAGAIEHGPWGRRTQHLGTAKMINQGDEGPRGQD